MNWLQKLVAGTLISELEKKVLLWEQTSDSINEKLQEKLIRISTLESDINLLTIELAGARNFNAALDKELKEAHADYDGIVDNANALKQRLKDAESEVTLLREAAALKEKPKRVRKTKDKNEH